jgi:monovalent cation:H+ antiporter, CPA1 family
MALSLPPGNHRDVVLIITDAEVVFSIIVQGLTVGRLVELTAQPTERGT